MFVLSGSFRCASIGRDLRLFFFVLRPNSSQFIPQAMAVDKKVANGHLRLILLKGPLGGCIFTGEYDAGAMKATIQDFCDRQ